MPFEKGKPRPPNAGRKKGSKNIKRIARVSDYLSEKDINPAEKLLEELAQISEPKDRAKIWLELLSYCQAKPKAVEEDESSDPQDDGEISTADLLKLVKQNGDA